MCARSLAVDPKVNEHRNHVIDEIQSTEESYAQALKDCIDIYYHPMLQNKLFDPIDVNNLFKYFHEIQAVSQNLVSTLQAFRQKGSLYSNTCGAFLKTMPFFRIYSQYASNSAIRFQVLKRFKASDKITAALRHTQNAIKGAQKMDLEGFLIMPVQRLPRYILLFNDLLKHTPEKHPDYIRLTRILKQFRELTAGSDQLIAETRQNQRLLDISKDVKWEDGDLCVGRKLVMDATATLLREKGQLPCFFVLCSDVFFYTKRNRSDIKAIYNTADLVVRQAADPTQLEVSADGTTLTIAWGTVETCDAWRDAFGQAIDEAQTRIRKSKVVAKQPQVPGDRASPGHAKPSPKTPQARESVVEKVADVAAACAGCAKEFSMLRRRNTCVFCSKTVCGDCCRFRLQHPETKKLERACAACFEARKQPPPSDPEKTRTSVKNLRALYETNSQK